MAYTRTILIGGRDFSRVAAGCTFKWQADTGCDSATITLPASTALDFSGIEFDEVVVIKWDTETWWTGIVTDMNESAISGLSVTCSGKGSTLLKSKQAFGKYGTDVLIPRIGPDNISYNLVYGEGKLGLGPNAAIVGYHTYCVTPMDSDGERISGHQTALSFHSEDRSDSPNNKAYTIKKSYDGVDSGPPGSFYRTVSLSKATLVSEGETLASLELSWDDDTRVAAWRVYKLITTDQSTASVGMGSEDTPANLSEGDIEGFHYVDVTSNEFVDDGTVDWASLPKVDIDDEIFDTCRTPSIVSSGSPYSPNTCSVRSAVRHLIKTLLSDDDEDLYNRTKISYGADAEIDDIDFDTDRASLYDALQTLADYAGGARFGVDADGDFYFYEKGKIGDASTLTIRKNSVDDYDQTAVDDITRSITRDGATTVDVALSEVGQAWVPVSTVDADTDNPRSAGVATVAFGVRTQDAVNTIAENIAADYKENFGTWSIKLSNVGKLIKASDLISVVHFTTTYVMEVKSADYTFDDVVTVSLSCGEPDIYDSQVKQQAKSVTRSATRNTFNVPSAGRGNPATAIARLVPAVCDTLTSSPGASPIPASIDHKHGYSASPVNAVMLTTDSHPLISRIHRGAASIVDLQKRVDETEATYVNGLAFAVGDLADISGVLYQCTSIATAAGEWSKIVTNDSISGDLSYAETITDVTVGDSSAAGVADTIARGDHKHGLDAEEIEGVIDDVLSGALDYGESVTEVGLVADATAGVADTVQRGDHKHGLNADAVESLINNYFNNSDNDLITSITNLLTELFFARAKLAKIISLDSGGDTLQVYMWDYEASTWETSATTVYRPSYLMKTNYNGITQVGTDGVSRTYNVSGVSNAVYQRNCVFVEDTVTYTELQTITPSYYVGESIYVLADVAGDNSDMNTAGRNFAAIGEPEEVT